MADTERDEIIIEDIDPGDVPAENAEREANTENGAEASKDDPEPDAPANEVSPGDDETAPSEATPEPEPEPELELREIEQKPSMEWEGLLAVLEREAESQEDASKRACLFFTAGEILEFQLGDPEKAIAHYQKAFGADPGHLPTLKAAQRLFAEAGHWDMVLDLLDTREKGSETGSERANVLIDMADILFTRKADPDGAMARLEKALEQDPDSMRAFGTLEKILTTRESRDEIVAFYERFLADVRHESRHAAMQVNLAKILEERADTEDRAIEIYQRILAGEDGSVLAIGALKRLLMKKQRWDELFGVMESEEKITKDPGRRALIKYQLARLALDHMEDGARAAQLLSEGLDIDPGNVILLDELETIYENENDWGRLAPVLQRQYELAVDPEKRTEIAFKLGTLYRERMDAAEPAAEWFERAMSGSGSSMSAQHILEELYAALGQKDKLFNILQKQAEGIRDREQKARKLFRLAEMAHRELNAHESAIAAYRQVLELKPGYLPAIKSLSELYQFTGRTDDWLEMNELLIENTPDLSNEQWIYLLEKSASLWEYKTNIGKAVECHQRILERHPRHLASIGSLGRLFAKSQQWSRLVEINQREADLIGDRQRVLSLLFQSGEISLDKLKDTEKAESFFRKVLELAPTNDRAIQRLAGLYENAERWEDLIILWEQELEGVSEGHGKARIHFKIAQAYEEKVDLPEDAEKHYKAVLANDPEFMPALHALLRVYQKTDNIEALIGVYAEHAEHATDINSKLLSVQKIAELYEVRLKDLEKAELAYRTMLEAKPDNPTAKMGLYRIHMLSDDHVKQMELVDRDLHDAASDIDRIQLLLTAANLHAEAEELDAAIEAYKEILNLDPDGPAAFQQLERLYRRTGRYGELADIYEAMLVRAKDAKEKERLLCASADLFRNHLDDRDRLREVYSEILRMNPNDRDALEYFLTVYASEKKWDVYMDLCQRLLELTRIPSQRLQLNLSLAHLYEIEFDRQEEALRRYERALEIDPACYPALQGLKRLYPKLHRPGELAVLLEKELKMAGSDAEFLSIAQELAALKDHVMRREDDALKLYLQILDRDIANDDVFERARTILNARKLHRPLVDILERRLEAGRNEEEALRLHRRIAEIAERHLADIECAIRHREKLVEKIPADSGQRRLLADLYAKSSRWEEAVRLYEETAAHLDDKEELKALYFEIGHLFQTELKDLPRASSAYETALGHAPNDLRVMDRLAGIYTELEMKDEAAEILKTLIRNKLPKDKELRYNLLLGEIHLDAPDEALPFFDRALALDPDGRVLERLTALFEERGQWEPLVGVYERHLESVDAADKKRRVNLLLEIARIRSEKLQDVEKSLAALEEASKLDPDNMEILVDQTRGMAINAMYYLDAIDKHRQLLDRQPFRVESYRELHRIFRERNERDKAFCALLSLDFLLSTDANQQSELRGNRERVMGGISAIIPDADRVKHLIHPQAKGFLLEFFQQLEPALYKMEPVDLERFDLPGCKVAGVNSSIYHTMENAAYHLGVDLFKIYISQKEPDLLAVENTKPATIVIGGNLAFAGEAIKRFLAGMVMSRIRNEHVLFADEDADKLRFWVEAVCQLYIPDLPVQHASMDETQRFNSKINRLLSKAAKKALETLAREYAKADPKPDFAAFRRALRHTDNRMGLLLSGDLNAAAECLVFLETGKPYRPAGSAEDIIEAFQDHEQLRELLRFAVSEDFFELRKIIRINVD